MASFLIEITTKLFTKFLKALQLKAPKLQINQCANMKKNINFVVCPQNFMCKKVYSHFLHISEGDCHPLSPLFSVWFNWKCRPKARVINLFVAVFFLCSSDEHCVFLSPRGCKSELNGVQQPATLNFDTLGLCFAAPSNILLLKMLTEV